MKRGARGAGGQRYPLIGGGAAWWLPLLACLLGAAGLWAGSLEAAAGAGALGYAAHRLARSLVIEVGPAALTRGLVLGGRFLGHGTVVPWPAVIDIHTGWSRPGDQSALHTVVRAADGTTVRFSTAMGLAAYWACLAAIAGRAPRATRSGQTPALLAGGPPTRRQIGAAVRVAAALALIVVGLVAMHHAWAQGRGSLVRYLELIGAADPAPPRDGR